MPILKIDAVLTICLFFIFHAFLLISVIYTDSWDFWRHKSLVLFLNLICFIAPIALLRSQEDFNNFYFCILCFSLLIAFLVFGLYVYDALDILRMANDSDQIKLPDYLALGTIIGIGILINFCRNTVLSLPLIIIGLSSLLLLGGRGPIISTIISIIFSHFYFKNRDNPGNMKYLKFFIISFCTTLALIFWNGADLAIQRFSATFSDFDELNKGLRSQEFSIALGMISSNPFWGVGLGGFGVAGYYEDADIYPHNLFLESWVEGGVISFVIFSVGIFLAIILGFSKSMIDAHSPALIILIYLILNYLKSGGFIGARDLFLFIGVLLAYVNFIQRSSVYKR